MLIRNAAFSNSALDTRWPLPGRVALAQRRLHRDDAEHRPHDVDDRGAGAQRPARRPGHEGKTGLELHDLVQGRAVLVRAGEIALQREIDQTRVERRQLLPADAEPLHRAGAVILDHDIGRRDQPVDNCPSLRPFQIDREAALVAVEGGEEPGPEPAEPARVIALRRRLDLDHLGAKLGEDQPGGRTHDRMREFEDPKARQRSCRHQAIPVARRPGKAQGGRDLVSGCRYALVFANFLGKSFALG